VNLATSHQGQLAAGGKPSFDFRRAHRRDNFTIRVASRNVQRIFDSSRSWNREFLELERNRCERPHIHPPRFALIRSLQGFFGFQPKGDFA
jgi:hypothetical protein